MAALLAPQTPTSISASVIKQYIPFNVKVEGGFTTLMIPDYIEVKRVNIKGDVHHRLYEAKGTRFIGTLWLGIGGTFEFTSKTHLMKKSNTVSLQGVRCVSDII